MAFEISHKQLQPLQELIANAGDNEDRIIVCEQTFTSCGLILTIGDRFAGGCVKVELDKESVCEIVKDFVPVKSDIEYPEYFWLWHYATPVIKHKLIKEIRDVLVFRAIVNTGLFVVA